MSVQGQGFRFLSIDHPTRFLLNLRSALTSKALLYVWFILSTHYWPFAHQTNVVWWLNFGPFLNGVKTKTSTKCPRGPGHIDYVVAHLLMWFMLVTKHTVERVHGEQNKNHWSETHVGVFLLTAFLSWVQHHQRKHISRHEKTNLPRSLFLSLHQKLNTTQDSCFIEAVSNLIRFCWDQSGSGWGANHGQ